MEHLSAWDFVIVGAGSAGCAVAYELVKARRGRVLLLEAGGSNRSSYIRVPTFVGEAVKRFSWRYTNEPDASRAGRQEDWARGRVLGGSSSINGMMFVRGARSDFDRWAAKQIPGWSWEDVAPVFRDMESSDQPGADRGHSGPLSVRTVRRPHSLTRAFLASAAAAGHTSNPDYNGASQEGVSLAQLSQRNGLRCSAADAFLKPIRNHPDLTIWTDCFVERLVFDGTRVTSAVVMRDGERREISGANFVLCGGSIGTPKLLLQSGVGDPEALRAIGIEPIVDAPEVGRNLMEHPLVRLVYQTKIASNNFTGGWPQKVRLLSEFLLHREGMISSVFEGAGFLKSRPELDAPDIQLHFLPFGVQDPVMNQSPYLGVPSVTVYVNVSHPKGRGRLSLRSNRPEDAPRIESDMLGASEDRDTLVRGIGIVRNIMRQEPMRELVVREIVPGSELATDAQLGDYVPAHTEIAYHVAGTCRMGSDPGAVVSPQLKLNGAKNVWIADASAFPDLISGNTNAACMMIGMKLGRMLGGEKARLVA